jgi:hypothetical protein
MLRSLDSWCSIFLSTVDDKLVREPGLRPLLDIGVLQQADANAWFEFEITPPTADDTTNT